MQQVMYLIQQGVWTLHRNDTKHYAAFVEDSINEALENVGIE